MKMTSKCRNVKENRLIWRGFKMLYMEIFVPRKCSRQWVVHGTIRASHETILYVCAVLKRLATPSDFHIPLPSVVPFTHSQIPFTPGCIYPIFTGPSGTASFFLTILKAKICLQRSHRLQASTFLFFVMRHNFASLRKFFLFVQKVRNFSYS